MQQNKFFCNFILAIFLTVILSWEIESKFGICEVLIFQSNQSGVYDYSKPIIKIPEIIIDGSSCIIKTQTIIMDLDDNKTYFWVARCKDNIGKMSINSSEVSTECGRDSNKFFDKEIFISQTSPLLVIDNIKKEVKEHEEIY